MRTLDRPLSGNPELRQVSGATVTRPVGLTASTYRLTGGGAANLTVRDAFLVHANGGTRKTGDRLPIKGIYAEGAISRSRKATAWE
jgi:hypothetical protein